MIIDKHSTRLEAVASRCTLIRKKSILLCVSTLLAAFVSLSIAAQTTPTLSDILEQAAFQQDTANAPERAIKLYRQIIESEKATRQMIAQALYNTGLCYAKLKRTSEANQAFGAVVSQYKGVEPYYRLASAQLDPSFTPTLPRWQDGERLEYETHVKNVDNAIDWYWTTTTKTNWNGRTAWKMTNRVLSNNGLSTVIADERTLRPLYSLANNPDIDHATATWTDNSIEINRGDQERGKEIRFEGVVYDAEQDTWLARQIPMSVGTKIKTDLLSIILTDKTIPREIEVIGEEQVQVPAGQFNAYKLTDDTGIVTYWIDKGPERYLLKMTTPMSSYQLKRISTVTPNAWRKVTSGTSSFSISIPDEWFNTTRMGERKYSGTKTISGKTERTSIPVSREEIYMLDDDTKLKFRIYIFDIKSLQGYENFDLSLEGRVADSLEQLPRVWTKFAVREGSRVDRVVAKLPAISYVADYQERNQDWVVYLTYVMRDTKMVWIGCLTPKSNFSEAKPTFDRMLSTMTF